MTKRKAPQETTSRRVVRKKQAVTKTNSSKTKAVIRENAENSPLLRMPSEIREKILVNLVGDNFIHVQHLDPWDLGILKKWTGRDDEDELKGGAFRHALCVATKTEQSAYQEMVSGTTTVPKGEDPDYYVEPFKKRHQNCMVFPSHDWQAVISTHEKPSLRVGLAVLGVCRQLYEEANHLLWDTNTFSFLDPETCNKFLASLNPAQKRNLRSLHISTFVDDFDKPWSRYSTSNAWLSALRLPRVNMLRNVRSLQLCLDHGCNGTISQIYASTVEARAAAQKTMIKNLEGIMNLRVPDLTQVTIIVSDDRELFLRHPEAAANRFTVAEKKDFAETLRAQLLDPRGKEAAIAADENRKAKDKLQSKEAAKLVAERFNAVAKRAAKKAAEAEEEARETEDAVEEALKNLEDATKNKAGIIALSKLYSIYDAHSDQVSGLRDQATCAAAEAKRWEVVAEGKAAKAERARARCEGRKPEKVAKKETKKEVKADRNNDMEEGDMVDEVDGDDGEGEDSS
ncbi:hypothetical protein P7C71_g567, partial [Lecanoromycetidae sp. Uapishka_2]